MQKKTLSVIVPVYNVEPYLRRCLDSILSQTRLPDEIICVDDGSTDRSGEIIDDYAKTSPVIKVIHKENGGLVSARKAGLRIASSDYATYVDSDDWIEADMYAEMLGVAEAFDADVITGGVIHDYGKSVVIENERANTGLYKSNDIQSLKANLIDDSMFFRRNIHFHLVDKLFRTENLKRVQNEIDDDVTQGEDLAVSYPYMLQATSCYVTGKCFYHYCARKDSVSNEKKDYRTETRKMLKYLQGKYENYENKIPGIMEQYKLIDLYIRLLNMPEEVIEIRNFRLYPYDLQINGHPQVVVYGAGTFGKQLKEYVSVNTGLNVVGWVDKYATGEGVNTPEILKDLHYDYLLVAVLLADVVEDIVGYLDDLGVVREKIRMVSI